MSRPALQPTQPPIQWVPGAPFLGLNSQGMKLITHLHLVPRSGMSGDVLLLPIYALVALTGTILPLYHHIQ